MDIKFKNGDVYEINPNSTRITLDTKNNEINQAALKLSVELADSSVTQMLKINRSIVASTTSGKTIVTFEDSILTIENIHCTYGSRQARVNNANNITNADEKIISITGDIVNE